MEQRGKLLLTAFVIAIVVLVGRLYYIQVTCGPALSAAAEGQQIVPVIYPYSRGIIYDRNMNKLTNTSEEYYYLVAKEKCTAEFKELIGHIGGKKAGSKGESYEVYHVEQFQSTINRLLQENFDAYGFCISSRYADEQVATHLIGYVNESDGAGASGLEKMYDQQLSCDRAATNLAGDGAGSILAGVGLNAVNGDVEAPAGLVTTIDGDLQLTVEKLLAEDQATGAVVVADIESGQILTMASSPGYNPNELESYLRDESSELVNKAVQCQYPAGPVLGIIEKTAALGKVSLTEAAASLGFGQCVWENFPDEAAGRLNPLEATPLQVCQMLVTLANGGENVPLSIVKSQAREESILCFDFANKKNLLDKPIAGDGWAAGLCENYAVTIYVEDAPKKAKCIYANVVESLVN